MALDSATFRSVRTCLIQGRMRFSEHALEEARADRVTIEDVETATALGECIEDYPDDARGPSCLALGHLADGSPVHMVWGHDALGREAILITVYRPDPERWSDDCRTRRGRDVAEDE